MSRQRGYAKCLSSALMKNGDINTGGLIYNISTGAQVLDTLLALSLDQNVCVWSVIPSLSYALEHEKNLPRGN